MTKVEQNWTKKLDKSSESDLIGLIFWLELFKQEAALLSRRET